MELSTLFIILPALVGFWILVSRDRAGPPPPPVVATVPHNAIVVDGSNVLHWGGEPSVAVLVRVLQELVRAGYDPLVFFDANVGYIIGDSYHNEAKLSQITGFPVDQICVVDKGVVADEAMLLFASDHGLRVVTNDRYRDWRVTFPHTNKKGVLLGGNWREGAVVWRGKL